MGKMDLSGLRDIHLPTHEIGIFPLAPGWWLLFFSPFLIWALVKIFSYLKFQGVKFYAMRELEAIFKGKGSVQKKVVDVSVLMKRLAIRKYGRTAIASLHGDKWAEFIQTHTKCGNASILKMIASSSYARPESFSGGSLEDVRAVAREFIRKNV